MCVFVLRILFFSLPPSKSPLLFHFTPFELNMFTASQTKHKAQQMLHDSCSRVYISLRVSLLTHKLTHTYTHTHTHTHTHRKSCSMWRLSTVFIGNPIICDSLNLLLRLTHTYTMSSSQTLCTEQCTPIKMWRGTRIEFKSIPLFIGDC